MTESVYDGAQTAADILNMANQISQHLDYLEFLLEKAGVLKDKAKHHYTKYDWQHMR